MPDIRYICLSDLHLGEESSILTNLKTGSTDVDPMKPSPVMAQLVECLKYLISKNEDQQEKPALILNGDLLELALTTDNQAAMVFERFVELTMREGEELFDKKVLFLPGNHDHHLWETARELQYAHYVEMTKPDDFLKIPWHTTKMFDPDPVPAYFLNKLIQRINKDLFITTVYPNFGLLSPNGQKSVIFHHGHFIESMYYLMSTLMTLIFPDRQKPRHVWDIEAENFAWIDFFWSTMGRSGEVGQDVELVYEKMQDPEQFKKLLSNVIDGLADRYNLPGIDMATARILKWIVYAAVDRAANLERRQPAQSLSPDGEKGLKAYMEGPTREQILIECGQTMPTDVTFVFGHTHKPFQEDKKGFEGYPEWVGVYNSGGWIVDATKPEPMHGGAIVLIDEELNTTSVRMYNELENPEEYAVGVEEATHDGKEDNPFHDRILGLIDPSAEPWKTFSALAASDVPVRAQNLQVKIHTQP